MNRVNQTKKEKKRAMEEQAFMYAFSHPDERNKYLEMLQLGSEFDMRPRSIFTFYGQDLITYKQQHHSCPYVNEFLRIFSIFLNEWDDDRADSWHQCKFHFWEALIIACMPNYIKVATKQNESQNFLTQLKKFVSWLDERNGCSWFETIEKIATENLSELQRCESILNDLYVQNYPHLNANNLGVLEDFDKVFSELEACSINMHSIFEVSQVSDDIITLIDLDTWKPYQIINTATNKPSPGLLIEGVFGKKEEDLFWTLYFPNSVYPNKAKSYFEFVD
ncbi:hypothetical protein [Aquibacillus sediminis]|uniref:hypothetical protein n=1 Tax=Aquibacillus sediminis TaxID=2574734 RepID=UPI001109AD2B|nr:hypothetical protein [Aquibacillus sediminis]